MTKLDIDFVDRGLLFWLYRTDRRWALLTLLGGLALLLGWLQWRSVQSDLIRLTQEQAQTARLQERPKPRPSAAQGMTAEQIKATNGVIAQLNQPWSELLETLESTRKGRVAFLELRFDPVRARIKGVAEAKDATEMLRFMTQLKAQPLMAQAHLSLHQISQTDPNKPYRFEFSADWRKEGSGP
jgi:hypothetical protein